MGTIKLIEGEDFAFLALHDKAMEARGWHFGLIYAAFKFRTVNRMSLGRFTRFPEHLMKQRKMIPRDLVDSVYHLVDNVSLFGKPRLHSPALYSKRFAM